MAKKELRPVDKVINDYSASNAPAGSRAWQFLTIPLLIFGLLGLIWSIPFPHLDFLGKYNGFVNWASFVIAFSIYYYYKLSPMVSYGVLLLVFALTAGIVGLEKWEKDGGLPMSFVCLVLFILGAAMQYFTLDKRSGGSALSPRSVLISPVWLISSVFAKVGLKI